MSNVTQADREAAQVYADLYSELDAYSVDAHQRIIDAFAAHRISTIEECADALVAYCRAMNESGKVPSFVDAHTAILALKGSTNG